MTLTQLTYAVAVDTHRHFGRAAAHCHVSQPTLSTQLRKLEDELGAPLFDRSRQPVVPTALGRELLAQARVVLRERDRLGHLAAGASEEVSGELHLGVLPTLAPYLLPLVTRSFAEAHPKARVLVHELTTEAILERLATDRLDAGLIATEEQRAGIRTDPIFEEPFVAYLAPPHRLTSDRAATGPIDPQDLAATDLWLLSEGHCFRDQVLGLCGQAGADPKDDAGAGRPVYFETGSLETLRLMVERTGGLTLLPALAALHLGEAGRARLRPLAAPTPSRTIRFAYGRAQLKRRLVEAYGSEVRRAVTECDEVAVL